MEHIDPKYIDLILRKLMNDLTSAEEEEFNLWLEESEDHKKIFEKYKEAFVVDDKILNINVDQEWNTFKKKISEEKGSKVVNFTPYSLIKYAAAAIIVVLLGIYFYLRPSAVYVAKQSNKVVVLPDHSIVKLQKGGKIVVDRGFLKTNRKLKLYGQAYFIVQHDENLPFVVESDGFSVQVVGTEFFVSQYDRQVLVNKGVVRVDIPSDKKILRAGEQAIITKKHIKVEKIEDKNIIAWATGVLVFKDSYLYEVFATLENNYGVKFIIENPKIKNYKLTATFKNQSLEEILAVIKNTEEVPIIKQSDKVYIVK